MLNYVIFFDKNNKVKFWKRNVVSLILNRVDRKGLEER